MCVSSSMHGRCQHRSKQWILSFVSQVTCHAFNTSGCSFSWLSTNAILRCLLCKQRSLVVLVVALGLVTLRDSIEDLCDERYAITPTPIQTSQGSPCPCGCAGPRTRPGTRCQSGRGGTSAQGLHMPLRQHANSV